MAGAIMAVSLFGEEAPAEFGRFELAFYSLFRIVAGDPVIAACMHACMHAYCKLHTTTTYYIHTYIHTYILHNTCMHAYIHTYYIIHTT
jgi:hypothetical protein